MKFNKKLSTQKTAIRQRSIQVLKRRESVREFLLSGFRDQSAMAVRLGVSSSTISNDVRAIFSIWKTQDAENTGNEFSHRIRQLDKSAIEAYNAFQRSKQNAEQVTTTYVRQTCPVCEGENSKRCKACDGTGTTLVENVTRRVTGQAGDSGHLRLYFESVREAAKLEGLYRGKGDTERVQNTYIYTKIDWSKVPPDKLLQIKRACDQARLTAMRQPAIEAKSEEVEE